MQNVVQARSSRLARTFFISLKQLIALLLVVIVISAVGYWAVQRGDMFKRWASQIEEAQALRSHLDMAYILLKYGNFETNYVTQDWFAKELDYADSSLLELMRLDESSPAQLGRIESMLVDLRGSYMHLIGLNSTDRNALGEALHDIGWKAVAAYANYLEPAGSSNPPLWYSGPSPPDETILEEAAELAIDVQDKLP